jgi:chitinase
MNMKKAPHSISRLLLPLFLLFVSASPVSAALQSRSAEKAPPKYKVIAYFFGPVNLQSVASEKLTHVNYAFALVSTEGQVVLSRPNSPERLGNLLQLKRRNPKLKILLSIGGWGADNFSDAAMSPESRDKFAQSAISILKEYSLDGVDVDWEYPGQPGPGIKFRPEDKANFTLLLKTIRGHLDKLSAANGRVGDGRYLLTIASTGGDYFKHTEMDRLHVYLDWINIMTYDFHTEGARTTGHHAGLFRSRSAKGDENAQAYVAQHLAAGIPPEKIVVGAAFYGRTFTGVTPENNGLYQNFTRYSGEQSYASLVENYINKQGFKRYWDETASAPYLWNEESATFITYEDAESLRAKADFVKSRKLAGLMYWQHSHDPSEVLLTAIYERFR